MLSEHPLFPAQTEDDEPPEVGYIHVTRFEAGKQPWCPILFAADELQGLDQLFELFGGGHYELIGRTESKGRIVARRRYELPGPSKPLSGVEAEPPTRTAPQSPPAGEGMGGGVLPLMFQMMQAQAQSQTNLLLAVMNQSTSMVTAMMNRDAESSRQHIATMQQLHDRSMSSQAQLLQTIADSRNAGGSGKDMAAALREGIDLGREMGIVPGQDDDSILETMGQVAGVVNAFTGAGGGANPVAAAAAAAAGGDGLQ